MSNTPGSVVAELVAATRQRLALRAAIHGAAIASGAAALLLSGGRLTRAASDSSIALDITLLAVVIAVGATIGWWQSRAARANAARTLDALAPASRNLLVTADELARGVAPTTDAAVASLVSTRADAIARTVSLDSVLPLRASAMSLAGGDSPCGHSPPCSCAPRRQPPSLAPRVPSPRQRPAVSKSLGSPHLSLHPRTHNASHPRPVVRCKTPRGSTLWRAAPSRSHSTRSPTHSSPSRATAAANTRRHLHRPAPTRSRSLYPRPPTATSRSSRAARRAARVRVGWS